MQVLACAHAWTMSCTQQDKGAGSPGIKKPGFWKAFTYVQLCQQA